MKILCVLAVLLTAGIDTAYAQDKLPVDAIFSRAEKQYQLMLKEHPDTRKFPFTLTSDGRLKDSDSEWWTSGFFPGTLWYLFEYTQKESWKNAADAWTQALAKEQYNTTTHDLGFMLYCSYGNGYRLTNNPAYKSVMLTGANSLATRFNDSIGLIKSWEKFPPEGVDTAYQYPVIIDNMMNLEYLFWAANSSGNKRYADIAVIHADKTLANHFRPDNSSYHVICYSEAGDAVAKKTWQGHSDESAWARGQAWALYGYTMMYRETKKPEYLEQAEKIASYILDHPNLPADKIPYWDFNAPLIPKEERDVSAATVIASALLELSTYSSGKDLHYFKQAETILRNLSSKQYSYQVGEGHGFLLKHSVGFKPKGGEVDVPLNYADYYYLEGLLRYMKLKGSYAHKPIKD